MLDAGAAGEEGAGNGAEEEPEKIFLTKLCAIAEPRPKLNPSATVLKNPPPVDGAGAGAGAGVRAVAEIGEVALIRGEDVEEFLLELPLELIDERRTIVMLVALHPGDHVTF